MCVCVGGGGLRGGKRITTHKASLEEVNSPPVVSRRLSFTTLLRYHRKKKPFATIKPTIYLRK